MVIALLAVLGVNLIVIAALVVLLLARRHWVKKQPGSFRGAIRVARGDIDGLPTKWNRGYGRWDRDVLVWTKGPMLLSHRLLPVDDLLEPERSCLEGLHRLGSDPVTVRLRTGSGEIQVAAGHEVKDLVLGPYTQR